MYIILDNVRFRTGMEIMINVVAINIAVDNGRRYMDSKQHLHQFLNHYYSCYFTISESWQDGWESTISWGAWVTKSCRI
jgi:hypothetical protein